MEIITIATKLRTSQSETSPYSNYKDLSYSGKGVVASVLPQNSLHQLQSFLAKLFTSTLFSVS